MAALSMFLSGGVMISRNRQVHSLLLGFENFILFYHRYLAWPALLVAIAGYVSARPMRQKDGGQGLSGILCA